MVDSRWVLIKTSLFLVQYMSSTQVRVLPEAELLKGMMTADSLSVDCRRFKVKVKYWVSTSRQGGSSENW